MQINKRKQELNNSNNYAYRLSHHFDPNDDSALKKPLSDEDEEMQEQVKEYLDRKSVPYVESQKIRDIKRGLIRIGTTFKLRQDFYSAMWIYLHKVDYLLPQASDLKS